MTQATLSPRAMMAILGLALLWGGSFLAIRTALDEIGPLTSVLYRTTLAAIVLWLVLKLKRGTLPRTRAVWVGFLGMGLLNNVIPFSLMAWGQLYIETGLTSIFNAATAIFGVLAAALFLPDERLTARKLLGVTLGFCGVVIAIGLENLASFSIQSLAQLAIISGTISYALAGVWARKQLAGLSPLQASTGMLICSSIVMLPLTLAFEGIPRLDLAPQTWAGIGYYAVFATAIAYLLYYWILDQAGAGNLLLVTLLIPPIAIVLGVLARGEALAPSAYLGFAVLAAGLLVLNPSLLRRKPKV